MTDASTKPVVLALSNTITPAIALEILPQGLAVNSLYLNADGETHDVIPGPYDSAQHATPPYKYLNTLVGRYANRIAMKEGGHAIQKNGYSATINPVKNESDKVSLHGGVNALDSLLFTQLKLQESTLFSEKELRRLHELDYSNALFTATLPHNSNGFPGTLRVEVLFALIDPATLPVVSNPDVPKHVDLGSVLVVYRARLAEPNIHWGFNLEASLRPTPHLNIRDHHLILRSPARVAIDSDLLPTGELALNSAEPAHDHNAGKKIGELFPEKGYDHSWLLTVLADHFYIFDESAYKASIATQPPRTPVKDLANIDLLSELLSTKPAEHPSVELWSDKSGYKISFSSNQGGVQFYTANFTNGAGRERRFMEVRLTRTVIQKNAVHSLNSTMCPLSAFLHPQNGIDSLLTSDELYHNYVRLDIGFKPPVRA
ncbi:SubName: Full=Uncharacterized protein {ECO:0000313/EMBL:CCA70298.1} [Serendipita indica DSM 11827]|nr:SubName: Full=Uncharacterized protein {ECO:0000313/EMBL:CCA70298.1} [Serendipita indica DSM 11827]